MGGDLSVGAIVSFQPSDYPDPSCCPNLNRNLEGTVPGFVAGADVSWKRALFAAELSSTTKLNVVQSGRLVVGGGPVLATHRDTLLSLLPGVRFTTKATVIDAKVGVSLIFGDTHREANFQFGDPGGDFAFTTGADVAVRLGRALAVVPNFRYSIAHRGDNAFYFGLGKHIIRTGVALRFQIQ